MDIEELLSIMGAILLSITLLAILIFGMMKLDYYLVVNSSQYSPMNYIDNYENQSSEK